MQPLHQFVFRKPLLVGRDESRQSEVIGVRHVSEAIADTYDTLAQIEAQPIVGLVA